MSLVKKLGYKPSIQRAPIISSTGAPVRTDIIKRRLDQLGIDMPKGEIDRFFQRDPLTLGWYRILASPALVLHGFEEPI